MIFPMSYFQLPPYTHGDTTMEDFFADQHYRRRFLQKYSTKLFPKVKKCKNEMCHNYHDNKHSYCSDECRVIWEQELIDRRYGEGHKDYSHLQCSNCEYCVPHKSGFRAFKPHCIEKRVMANPDGDLLVNPDHWCQFFIKRNNNKRNNL